MEKRLSRPNLSGHSKSEKSCGENTGCGLILSDEENSHYEGGITVFDSMSVKGLEFDRVVVCGAGIADYRQSPERLVFYMWCSPRPP